ncbi:hypothetical protein ONZ51_g13413 [Trametes cubensis]|uniref:Uncharacterized protein n=1 Tax=Trametes cubensis TaxID=1111947 RepID=A0AAD7X362_9APHY|nr:hypothetical protein ONZ51_g13413 [Trametes cubensis]
MSHPETNRGEVTIESIHTAAKAIAAALGGCDNASDLQAQVPYAIVGGGACILLGSHRITEDVDFVVPQNTTAAARKLLRASPAFRVDPRTCHTWHRETGLAIEIVTMWFQRTFDARTPALVVDGVRVLHPVRILDAKCRSILARSALYKKNTDAHDIVFLLEYCVRNGIAVKDGDVEHAKAETIEYLIAQEMTPREAWNAAGYVDDAGWPQ